MIDIRRDGNDLTADQKARAFDKLVELISDDHTIGMLAMAAVIDTTRATS